jgi:hypothetical protein
MNDSSLINIYCRYDEAFEVTRELNVVIMEYSKRLSKGSETLDLLRQSLDDLRRIISHC